MRGFEHVVVRIDSGELRALEQGEEEGSGMGPSLGVRAVVVLAPDPEVVQSEQLRRPTPKDRPSTRRLVRSAVAERKQ